MVKSLHNLVFYDAFVVPEQILTKTKVTVIKVIQSIMLTGGFHLFYKVFFFLLIVKSLSPPYGISLNTSCAFSLLNHLSVQIQLMFHLYSLCLCVFIT